MIPLLSMSNACFRLSRLDFCREVRLRECYQELLQSKEQIVEEHRNQLHEQSKLSREKDKRQVCPRHTGE